MCACAPSGSRATSRTCRPTWCPPELAGANPALATLGVDLQIARDVEGADVVHSHTWYANGAGQVCLAAVRHPARRHRALASSRCGPWKAEQLGGGYRLSSWLEETAFEGAAKIIAVSEGMRRDILRSYPRPRRVARSRSSTTASTWSAWTSQSRRASSSARLGIDPNRPAVVFVGRITRQKGLPYLLRAAALLPA